jgi:hypothetical protein
MVAAGCGSSSGGGGGAAPSADAAASTETSTSTGNDAGTTADAPVEAAPYPAFVPTDIPQVADTHAGPVLALPKVYPIYFASDDPTVTAQITDFLSKVGATNYWNTIGAEYGVGSLVGETPIQLTATDNPPALYYDSQIEDFLADKLGGGDAGPADPAFPVPDGNTIFAFFFPSGVTIDEGFEPAPGEDAGAPNTAAESCTGFGGYHSAIQLSNGTNVPYAVIPRCSNFDGFTGIDAVTAAASHELVEGATDPFGTAYSTTDAAHHYWATVVGGGGEVGDMCAQTLSSFTHFSDLPAYLVQRCWSNKVALTGGDPCVPVPSGDVYFNTFPVMPDVLQVASGRPPADGGATATTPTKGVKIAVGASATIELDLFSNVPTSEWSVAAYDTNTLNQISPQLLQFSFDKNAGKNGDKIHMTIKVLAAGRRNTEAFAIYSMMGTSPTSPQNIWAGVVGN